MQRILNADIVDITPIDGGFIYAEKKMLENGSCRVSFYSYDCETSISTPITRGEYVSCKFGQNGSRIADELGQKGEFIQQLHCHSRQSRDILALHARGFMREAI